jgi:hypothetical protein
MASERAEGQCNKNALLLYPLCCGKNLFVFVKFFPLFSLAPGGHGTTAAAADTGFCTVFLLRLRAAL